MAIDTTRKYQSVTVVFPTRITPIDSALLAAATSFAVANTLVKRNSDGVAYTNRYGAMVASSADQSIPNGAHTAVTYAVSEYQIGNLWTIGNPSRMYAPVSGIYLIQSTISFLSNAVGVRTVSHRQAGAIYANSTSNMGITGANHSISLATLAYMVVGDYFETMAYQLSTAALNVVYQQYLSARMKMFLL